VDQELKQRLIGAAVITALAAIFVPMLFDDPIDETGKSINELKIPDMPAKVQDVDIMPLPEKADDVATTAPIDKPELPQTAKVADLEEPVDEADVEAQPAKIRLAAKETAIAPRQPKQLEADVDVAEVEDVAPRPETLKSPAVKPTVAPASLAPVATPVKTVKPAIKTPEAVVLETPNKPAAAVTGESATNRWYLNAGSFSQKANAQSLLDTLKQQGFAANIKEVASDKGMVYKVRVGPMLDKLKAQIVKSKLAQLNINSFVSGDE
jgi:DedD protein